MGGTSLEVLIRRRPGRKLLRGNRLKDCCANLPARQRRTMSKLQDSQAGSTSRTHELRRNPRRKLAGMAYVELAHDNGGILLNLGEGGLAVQSALALSSRDFPGLRFQLPNMRGWLTASGRVAWMSESKKEAGIQFLDLHEHARAQIRMWVAKEGLEETSATGAPEQMLPKAANASAAEPTNGVDGPNKANGVEGRTPENLGGGERNAAVAPLGQEGFRFHDYSMFAADASGGVPWAEPIRQKRSWGSYVLFTMLLAALFFVLGAMIGRDNLNGLVSSVEDWKQIRGEAPPNVKPPGPPQDAGVSTPSAKERATPEAQGKAGEEPRAEPSQGGSSGDNAVEQKSGGAVEQKSGPYAGNEKSSASREADAAGNTPGAAIETAKRASSAGTANATPEQRSVNANKNGRAGRRDSSYLNAEPAEPSDYGRSILVNAPAPGSPPFFVNLPGEAVSASSSVAISARRSIQVPPRADASGYGSERVIIGKLMAHSDPFYPAEAANKRIEGIVELHALIGRSGQIVKVTPVSGPDVLVAAGVTAVHEWRYEPTFINGDPVETNVDVTMVFRSR